VSNCLYRDMPWTGKRVETCEAGYFQCPNDGTCKGYKPIKAKTNADRIRSMNDEELQKFLLAFEAGDIDYAKTFCDLCCKDAALERKSADCDGCLLWWLKNGSEQPQGLDYWLKQPAED